METGTLILARTDSQGELKVAERTKEYLLSKGRRNVYVGVHRGKPDCYDVFLQMNNDGVDTYCILPLAVFEGNQTVWNMPKHLTLPDNCGSWTMIGEHDVATRFSTALGANETMITAIWERLVPIGKDVGVILACHGSKLSFPSKSMHYYSECLKRVGCKVSVASCATDDDSMKKSEEELTAMGCEKIHIVPFYIDAESSSLKSSVGKLTMPYTIGAAVSEYEEFYSILDSKVPEGW